MSKQQDLAVRALVLTLLEGYLSSSSSITDATLASYAIALDGVPLDIVRLTCGKMIRGEIERKDRSRAPTAEELSRAARELYQQRRQETEEDRLYPKIENLPPGYTVIGGGRFIAVPFGKPMPPGFDRRPMGTIDYGNGMVRLDGLTEREATVVDRLKGILPNGQNLASMSLVDKKSAINQLLNQKAISAV